MELGNKVIMCLIANLANYTGDPSELTMRLTFTDNNGALITEERPLELYNPDSKHYAVSYDGLRATEMRSIVSTAIYHGETRVSKTVEYSIESYGTRSSDAAMRSTATNVGIRPFYYATGAADWETKLSSSGKPLKVGEYMVVTIPLADTLYADIAQIEGIQVAFYNVVDGNLTIDYVYFGPESNLPTPHSYKTSVPAPTCTTQGYTTYTCETCGYSYVSDYVEAGHNVVVDTAAAPTCTETGLTEGTHCSSCGEIFTAQEVIPALGHTEVIDAAVAAICDATSLTEGKHCDVCGEILVAQEEVAAMVHTEVIDAAVEANCDTTGLTESKHCSVCNEVIVARVILDALGHAKVIDEAVAATCTETGLTEGKHWKSCSQTERSADSLCLRIPSFSGRYARPSVHTAPRMREQGRQGM